MNILVIEDDRMIRESLTRFLQDHKKFQVFCALGEPSFLDSASSILQTEKIQKAIIDIDLINEQGKLENGIIIALELKKINPQLPICFVSGNALLLDEVKEHLELKGAKTLAKPYTFTALMQNCQQTSN